MLYSVNYKSRYMNEAYEIRCPLNQLGLIYAFIKDNPGKRYVVTLSPWSEEDQIEKAIEQVNYIIAAGGDYTIACNTLAEVRILIKEDYHAYLNAPVTDWETFNRFVYREKASDVWIDGPLGFQVKELETASIDVNIRAVPNADSYSPQSFFIRPEDVCLYEQAIHVLELKADVEFEIYERGSWNQDINYLIKGLPEGVNNSMIMPEFGESRANCGQRCMAPTRHCHLCTTEFSVVKNSIKLLKSGVLEDEAME